MKHPFSDRHKAILNSNIVQFVEKPDSSSVSQNSYYTNYTIAQAINNYVSMGTELKSYTSAFIISGSGKASSDDNAALDRLVSYMIDNGMGTLRYYVGKAQDCFFSEVDNEVTRKGRVITILMIVDPIIIVMLMVLFVPFILKVQSSLLRIYLHLCQFKDADIMAWLEACNNSAADIRASVTQMRKIYASVTFDIKLQGQEEAKEKVVVAATPKPKERSEEPSNPTTQETTLQTNKKLLPTGKGTENNEEKKSTEEDAEQLIISKDEAISERKQKMFSRMTQEKTKNYLIYLFVFALYIGMFKTADGMVFSSLYGDTDIRTYSYQILSSRSLDGLLAMFFLREELRRNVVLTDFDSEFSFSPPPS